MIAKFLCRYGYHKWRRICDITGVSDQCQRCHKWHPQGTAPYHVPYVND